MSSKISKSSTDGCTDPLRGLGVVDRKTFGLIPQCTAKQSRGVSQGSFWTDRNCTRLCDPKKHGCPEPEQLAILDINNIRNGLKFELIKVEKDFNEFILAGSKENNKIALDKINFSKSNKCCLYKFGFNYRLW